MYVCNELAGNTAIIFTATCATTQRLALLLRALGFSAVPLHGQLSQAKRLASLHKFKAGERSILIATDVASRGLDIPAVDLVLNYELPANSKDYIHRVGRTARAGRAGRAITLVTQYDVEVYQRIEHMLGKKLEEFPAPQDEVCTCSPLEYDPSCAPHVHAHRKRTACAPHVHRMCTACAPHVHHMRTACAPGSGAATNGASERGPAYGVHGHAQQ